MASTHTFDRREEIANAVTHGIGALLSVAALVLLIVFSSIKGTAWHVVSFTIYGASMLLLYLCSTLVHSFKEGKAKDLFEFLDHSSIYIFIAGTYTPFLLVVLRGPLGWSLFGTVWGIALLGVVFKAFFVKRFLFLSTVFYLIMGWLIVIAWGPLTAAVASQGIVLLVTGGVLYTLGTVFYVWRGFPYHHAIWHLFVLGGSVTHFFAILLYLLPHH
ncbi:MAG: hemolysin III family protein [Paenibacillus macerans]|uniref:Hemolysin III family protein n=1 Tax=Paenibacillus macerans TaxID=44252 RepID=A0A090XVM8_PAEMA|nr:hemolysin III family protein [Paenibacillus macerans]KFM90518.1 channel, hemolysin III family protein [Paenibacillus macerans]MBS5910899.1 hemolysin III family protein [Paenibacillus macerans]MCY7559974.1 hemolysin III family protein [Paenibacillus macerans]MDU5946345.1 hemolysin III family protein [Paenibacillus macerans]MDU7475301.1 hemolysin III family protein [Paenibacillus macerans]